MADLDHHREAGWPTGEHPGQAVASFGGTEAWWELEDDGEQAVAEWGERVAKARSIAAASSPTRRASWVIAWGTLAAIV